MIFRDYYFLRMKIKELDRDISYYLKMINRQIIFEADEYKENLLKFEQNIKMYPI